MRERVRIGIFGASGYTGAELLRLLGDHPLAEIRALTAERQAGKPVAEVWPQLAPYGLPDLVRIQDVDVGGLDVVFCALPHATTQAIIRELPRGPKVVDLSADFRLRDPAVYEATYGHPHQALEAQADAVYGLSEHYRDADRPHLAGRQPGLLHHRGRAAAGPAAQARADPAGRHHHRRQVGRERRRPRRQAGQPVHARSPRASTPTASPPTGTRPRSSSASPTSLTRRSASPSRPTWCR